MLGTFSYKTKQFFFTLIKLSIVVGASYFIYHKLAYNDNLDFNDFIVFLNKNDLFLAKNILFLIILSVFNWFFEILKWQNLVSSIKNISFFEALKQSLAALTASLFTPNRIGEYGAKAVYFTKPLRKRILFLNLIGNIAQMTTTLVFGIIGFSLFNSKYDIDISPIKLFLLITLVVIIIGFLFFISKQKKFKIKGISLQRIKEFILEISKKVHFKNIALSVIRYLIFSFQFYYLLTLFGVYINYINAMIVIASMYLLSSIIPTIFVFDVVVKGSVALFLFDFAGVNELTILSVITLMWILNFVLPSVFGGLFVLNFDYDKTSDNLD
ncbi:flippase-like domain-containing protein [Olleya sp. AH-315-F22]|nr:flippase-like domain-containing protein [Olleya sp. AH-315-F22]